ncbi:MAG: hypothetical protein M0Z67_00190 [Nitrospiraceae bacterium]|nr:hypothetical protein [Nitrospiraceae bacterium]
MDDKQGVDVIDAKTGDILATVLGGIDIKAVAIDEQRRLLAAADDHNFIYVLSADALNTLKTLSLKEEPTSISFDSALGIMLVTTDDNNAIAIDVNTCLVLKKIIISDKPASSVIDQNLNLAVIAHQTWGVGQTLKNAAASGGRDNITIVDLTTLSIVKTLQAGKEPIQAALNPSTHEVAVANSKSDNITVIDLNSLSVKKTIPSGRHPLALSYNECTNALVAVGGGDNSWMQVVDTDAGTARTTAAVGDKIEDVKVHPLMNRVFLAGEEGLNMIDLPNPVPVLVSITPENALRGSQGIDLTINGQGLLENTEIDINGIKRVSSLKGCGSMQVGMPGDYLQTAGDIEIKAINPVPDGGTSNLLYFDIDNPIPQITGLDPAETAAGTTSLTISVLGTGFFNDTVFTVNGVPRGVTLLSPTDVKLDLSAADLSAAGYLNIGAFNLPPGGGSSAPLAFTVKPTLEITITSPPNSSTVNKATTVVKGTFKSDTNDVGILVNGIPAEISGREWVANGAPLTVGTNSITATISDISGNKAGASITVNTMDTIRNVRLSANITSGVAPTEIVFSATSSFPPVSYQMDFEGDGIVDYTGPAFENMTWTYGSEGIFYPTLTITDNQGNVYSDTVAIVVLSKAELGALLKGKWEAMKSALNAKETEKALGYFVDSSKERYRSIFEALKDRLPAIMATFVEFNIIEVYENLAEYEVVANENSVLYSYPGLLVRDRNGIWKFRDF